MKKCIFCEKQALKNEICEDHYFLIKKEYKNILLIKRNAYEVKNHYHNLRYSIIKSSNYDYFIVSGIKLISLSFLYAKQTGDSSIIKTCLLFLRKQSILKTKIIEINEAAKKSIINKEWSDLDFRLKWTKNIVCEDGHEVRSLSESIIDNWLYNHNVTHAYEKQCIINCDKNIILYPDFYIPTINVYLEYWGRYEKEYLSQKAAKKALYKENNINVIYIEANDMTNIDMFMSRELLKHGLKIKKDN